MTEADYLNSPAHAEALEKGRSFYRTRFAEAASEYQENLTETLENLISESCSPGDIIALANALTLHDGYNPVVFVEAERWARRPHSGWNTLVSWRAPARGGGQVTLLFEARYDDFVREMIVDLEEEAAGERTPERAEREARWRAHGYRVLVLSATDALDLPERFRSRVEDAVNDLTDRVLMDAGHIKEHDQRARRDR